MVTVMILFPVLLGAQPGRVDENIDSGYALVNGTKLYYELAGKGQPLVLIHGSFGDRRHWDFQFLELSKKYRVLRYDVRGFGRSAIPDTNELYRDADDLNSLTNYLGITKAHICGLSMGSIIAIDFALAYPGKCISLITIGPRVAGDSAPEYKTSNSDTVQTIIAKTTEILKNKGAKEATDYLWNGDHAMSKSVVSPITRKELLTMGYEYSWWRYRYTNKREQVFPMAIKELKKIKMPTLVVTAEFDLELCKEVASILTKEIEGARLISIKGAGHIMNMDKPEIFNNEISAFLLRL
jgi:pimeloyl-ACP methyl ester carboxylesterase